MKAITIRQPWAWAIFNAGKDVENRGWQPRSIKPGETIAIHVAKRVVDDWDGICNQIAWIAECANNNDRRVVPSAEKENTYGGHIIGIVDVVGWTHADDLNRWSHWAQAACFHWRLDNPRLIVPTPTTGKLGLWEVPTDLQIKTTP